MDENSFWSPPRYQPKAISEGDRTLSLIERVTVRDGGYAWQPATALLDTGNGSVTIIDEKFAARHAIYRPGFEVERYTIIRGVVPGATSQAPIVTIAIQIRGQDLIIPAAIAPLTGEDILLNMDSINQLFAAGFRLGAGSA